MHLRSIELYLPDVAAAAAFLTGDWGAIDAGSDGAARYVRGTASLPYLVALKPGDSPSVASITFTSDEASIAAIAARAAAAGNVGCTAVGATEPGGGRGILVTFPDGEQFRFLTDCSEVEASSGRDAPVKLTHVVLNARDAEYSAQLAEDVLGFRVSDRTKGMVFVRCNRSHHSIAFARAGYTSLNHIAFEMDDLDAVMRGVGRMRDAGLAPAWGPGRHGPGANVFAYFIAPFGAVVEFSTAVEQVEADYRVGSPEDWTWPANRIDHWGLSDKQDKILAVAERTFRFFDPTEVVA